MTIYLDLDGTILDISKKYINLFCELSGLTHNSGNKFWEYKRMGTPTKEILNNYNFSEVQQENFETGWFSLIETDEYILFDTVFPGLKQLLELKSHTDNLVICTARQDKSLVINQLKNLQIFNLFNTILVTEKKSTKASLIFSHRELDTSKSDELDWLVGDTFEDIETGFNLGINTCAVLTGLTPIEKFRELNNPPTLIKESLNCFLESH